LSGQRDLGRTTSISTLLTEVSFSGTIDAPLSSPIPRRASRSSLLGDSTYSADVSMQGPFPSPPITPTIPAPSPPTLRRRSVRFEDAPLQAPEQRDTRASSAPIAQTRAPQRVSSMDVLSLAHPPLHSSHSDRGTRQRKRSQSQVSQTQEGYVLDQAERRGYRAWHLWVSACLTPTNRAFPSRLAYAADIALKRATLAKCHYSLLCTHGRPLSSARLPSTSQTAASFDSSHALATRQTCTSAFSLLDYAVLLRRELAIALALRCTSRLARISQCRSKRVKLGAQQR
jgi:hypothetical protein